MGGGTRGSHAVTPWVECLEEGAARLLVCPAQADAFAVLTAYAEAREQTVVATELAAAGKSSDLRIEVLRALADVARRLWPRWCGTAARESSSAQSPAELLAIAESTPGVSPAWLHVAWRCAASGHLPSDVGFSRAVHAEQLARVLATRILLVITMEGDASGARLHGLACTADWLARQTRSRVIVVLPPHLASAAELDSISYGAFWLECSASDADAGMALPPSESRGASEVEHAQSGEAVGFGLWPILGQPHPLSPGEQQLAAALARDPVLRDLFRFNVPLSTRKGSRVVVDLLWSDGKLVVEVDSFRYHSGGRAFCHDRQRDYELMITGYRVLRLPHQEVVANVGGALSKLRDVVQFLRKEKEQ